MAMRVRIKVDKYGSIRARLNKEFREALSVGRFFRWIDGMGQVVIYPHPKGDFKVVGMMSIPMETGYEEGRYDVFKIGNLFVISKFEKPTLFLPLKLTRNNRKGRRSNIYNQIKDVVGGRYMKFDVVHHNGYLYLLIWNYGMRSGYVGTVSSYLLNRNRFARMVENVYRKLPVYNFYGYPLIKVGKLKSKYRKILKEKGLVRIPALLKFKFIEDVDFTKCGRSLYIRKNTYRLFKVLYDMGYIPKNVFKVSEDGLYTCDAKFIKEGKSIKVEWIPRRCGYVKGRGRRKSNSS